MTSAGGSASGSQRRRPSSGATGETDPAAERLAYLARLIENVDAHASTFFDLAAPASELEADDAQLGPFQLSHLVGHCLAVSLDAQRTVLLVLRNPETGGLRVPMIGLYPLLRTVMEANSLAIWLLMPDDRAERLRRAIRARMDDVKHDTSFSVAATEVEVGDDKPTLSRKNKMRRDREKSARETKRQLRDLATQAGISVDDVNVGLPGFGSIIGEAAPALGLSTNIPKATWHFVSGLTHPSLSRSVMGSNVEWVDEDPTSQALFTANFDNTAWAMDAAIYSHLTALKLVAWRGGRPELVWSPGPDFAPPPGYRRV
ncbi:hypothetical protein [Leifsonia sp. PS1209]|uniref:hypothetical protein n=1 Tax=Leifsonia sp. PS1209 TaxID=2724914 RepID=UPI001442E127|nr:hypothetical protein [Leifsonia sp. PS1209]QIZ97777.1 hypothetical protein HF024_04060 [Leifsonia sp. PS1209]